jgi:hypothetical protein
MNAKMSHALSVYEGIYNHPGYGNMDVYIKNDSLFMGTAKQTMWLGHWHYDFFYPYFVEPGEKIDTTQISQVGEYRVQISARMLRISSYN